MASTSLVDSMIITARNPLAKIFNQPSIVTFEGELVATPHWVDYEAICLSTNRSDKFKFRVIAKKDIIEINGTKNTYVEPTKAKEIIVEGSKGSKYIVTVDGNRTSCTCSGFQFRRSCRHIMEARAA